MKKEKLNYLVDFLTFISFLITALSGLAMFFFMPEGVRQGRFQTFLGIQKGSWVAVHDLFGIALILFAVVHLVLHWEWIVCMTKNFFKSEKCETKPEK